MDGYDLVIRGSMLVDPEKLTITEGNLGVRDGRIAALTREDIHGREVIDARGKLVAPGFIDIHGHIDGHRECAALSAVQGVTTTVGGNCGIGPLDLETFFVEQEQRGFPINQAQLVGHSITLREKAGLTDPYQAASPRQIAHMAELAEIAFQQGAIGLSFGLEYAPGSSWAEITALSRVAARHRRLVPIHTRMLARGDLASLQEAIDINAATGATVLLSHFVYQYGGGLMGEALALVDDARRQGLRVMVDSGMYTAFATFIGSPIFSPAYMKEFGWQPGDLLAATGQYCGLRLTEPLYHELREQRPQETVICFSGNEAEIGDPFLKDYTMVSSDAGPSPSGNTAEGHPQNTGTFPRFLRKLVREQQKLPLAQAIAQCTLLPAQTLGLARKGRLAPGCDADLVIFDFDRITDRADFPGLGRPDAPPEGIAAVLVNGRVVAREGVVLPGVLPGKPIRAGACGRPLSHTG